MIRLVEQVTRLMRSSDEGRAVPLLDAQRELMAQIATGKSSMVRTGTEPWDRNVGGVPKSGVVTFLGYPSGGKTTLALWWALAMGIGFGEQPPMMVRVVSSEMGVQRVAATMTAQHTQVAMHEIVNKGRQPNESEGLRIAASMDVMGDPRVDIAVFEHNVAPPTLYAELAALTAEKGPGLLVFDYLQDVAPFGPFVEEQDRSKETMRIMRAIAKELGWLVFVVSQIGKQKNERANQRPKMTDGLGTSAIEYTSDMIVSVWRPHQHDRQPVIQDQVAWNSAMKIWESRRSRVVFSCLKWKFGTGQDVEMYYDGPRVSFRDPTEEERRAWSRDDE
jgi:replicative DNA helicase